MNANVSLSASPIESISMTMGSSTNMNTSLNVNLRESVCFVEVLIQKCI